MRISRLLILEQGNGSCGGRDSSRLHKGAIARTYRERFSWHRRIRNCPLAGEDFLSLSSGSHHNIAHWVANRIDKKDCVPGSTTGAAPGTHCGGAANREPAWPPIQVRFDLRRTLPRLQTSWVFSGLMGGGLSSLSPAS